MKYLIFLIVYSVIIFGVFYFQAEKRVNEYNQGWDESKEYYQKVTKIKTLEYLVECEKIENNRLLEIYLLESEKINDEGVGYIPTTCK